MSRKWTWALCLAATVMTTTSTKHAQAGAASETLLPATTKGFFAITDLADLSARWKKTQLGQLAADPVMKPFADDLRHQMQRRWSSLRDKLGLTLDDLEGVPGGELAIATIQVGPQQAAVCLVIDVTNHQNEAKELIQKATTRLTGKGARSGTKDLGQARVLVFDLPQQEQNTYYVLKDDLLVASTDLSVIQGVLARKAGQSGGSLADVPGFKGVMARCQKDAGDHVPQVRWFIEPIAYGELNRATRPESHRRQTRRGKDMFDVIKKQGFTAIRGIGGYISVDAEGTQVLHRTVIYAPPPYEKSMKMLKFVNDGDFTPPAWVPRDVATYTTFYADAINAFDNFGPLFDELFGEGETDVWKDTLEGLRDDPDGPRIDLREELFVHLGTRIIVLTDYIEPITPTSERLLFAIQTKDEAKVAAAIRKAMEKDDTMRRRQFEGRVIWESIPPEKKPTHAPVVELGRVPSLGPDSEEEEEEEAPKLLPNQAVTVANGYLIVASNYDFLTKILTKRGSQDSLATDPSYLAGEEASAKLGASHGFLRSFSRTDEEYRPTYEMLRQDKMPQSETLLARLLNTFSSDSKPGTPRQQQVDGSKMPNFDEVRNSLGSSGFFGYAEENGWFVKGYMLPKQ